MTRLLVSALHRLLVGSLVTTVIAALALSGSTPTRTVGAGDIRLAKNGDTHITNYGLVATIDCNDSTIFVNGSKNQITTVGSCYAISVQGSSNTVVADNVVDNIIVYGSDETVLYKTGNPAITDRGRELGMMNLINRIPG